MIKSLSLHALESSFWKEWVDTLVPQFVKEQYCPKPGWKNKPFQIKDAEFFARGVLELSELFTARSQRALRSYFEQAKFRSSYLLYFLPLQTAKFLKLFEEYPEALEAGGFHEKTGKEHLLLDFGSGPGTASFALLFYLLERSHRKKEPFPRLHFYWIDQNRSILKDGLGLMEQFKNQYPFLKHRVQVSCFEQDWWTFLDTHPEVSNPSFCWFGNVLNEHSQAFQKRLSSLFSKHSQTLLSGAGSLLLEPAEPQSAHQLSIWRDTALTAGWIQNVWGPCLHQETCPLKEGKDWCHASFPIHIPGKWFLFFSKLLGSERRWVKCSYLWPKKELSVPALAPSPWRRVISDPMPTREGKIVLLCEPNTPFRWKTTQPVFRGEKVMKPGVGGSQKGSR